MLESLQYKKHILLKSIESFEIFEAIRSKEKGGTLIGIHQALRPILIKVYEKDFELICVKVDVGNREIRVITGYGPQESWSEQSRLPFFHALEEEISKAKNDGKHIIIEMDSNSKWGLEVFAHDPHLQTANGKELWDIVGRQGLLSTV